MEPPRGGRRIAASLNTKVVLLTVAIFSVTAGGAYWAFNRFVDAAVTRLGTLFAEKQVEFDRYRGLETLSRETALAQSLARSPAVLDWAAHEADPGRAERGLAELEHYRLTFKDHSYFFVVDKSGKYYFNDRDNTYAGNQYRYTLSPSKERDGWYYKTASAGSDCRLNVDNDDTIRVTKVWVNCPVVQDGAVLGVVGTGIDLTDFIRDVVDVSQKGIDTVFVDASGAIQAHRDPKLVDFHSLTKDAAAKKTVFNLLDREVDRQSVAEIMRIAAIRPGKVETRFVEVDGRKVLAGVGYLDRIGWFNVTLMDVDELIERRVFDPLGIFLTIVLGVAVVLSTLLFRQMVMNRITRLEAGVRRVRDGDDCFNAVDPGNDEIGRLSRAINDAAKAARDNRRLLEGQVLELERMAGKDH